MGLRTHKNGVLSQFEPSNLGLGTQTQSPGRADGSLNHWAVTSANTTS